MRIFAHFVGMLVIGVHTDFILGDSLRGLWGKFNDHVDTILSFLDHLTTFTVYIGFWGFVKGPRLSERDGYY